VTASGLHLSD
jgi:hypothetical protein